MPYKDPEKRKASVRRLSKIWHNNNLEKHRAANREWSQKNPVRHRYNQIVNTSKRGGFAPPPHYSTWPPCPRCCEICGVEKNKSLCVDHDHVTGTFRGWLCGPCNSGLGKMGDSVEGLERAIKYLKKLPLR